MSLKYEWLRVRQVYKGNDYILDPDGDYLSWADDIPEGWFKSFGVAMLDELNTLLEKYNYTDKYSIIQIKEKYGMLRWYDSGVPEEALTEYYALLSKYEAISEKTCIQCGLPSTHTSTGWVLPFCDLHRRP